MPSENHSSSKEAQSGLKEITLDQLQKNKQEEELNTHFKNISPNDKVQNNVRRIDPKSIRLLSSRGTKKEIINLNPQNSQNGRFESARQIQNQSSTNLVKTQQISDENEDILMRSQANGNIEQSCNSQDIRTEIESASFQDISEPNKKEKVSDGNDSAELMSSI